MKGVVSCLENGEQFRNASVIFELIEAFEAVFLDVLEEAEGKDRRQIEQTVQDNI